MFLSRCQLPHYRCSNTTEQMARELDCLVSVIVTRQHYFAEGEAELSDGFQVQTTLHSKVTQIAHAQKTCMHHMPLLSQCKRAGRSVRVTLSNP